VGLISLFFFVNTSVINTKVFLTFVNTYIEIAKVFTTFVNSPAKIFRRVYHKKMDWALLAKFFLVQNSI